MITLLTIIGVLIFIVMIFIVYQSSSWILKKLKIGSDKSRRNIAIAPAILLAPVLVIAIFIGSILIEDSFVSRDYYYFDEYTWRAKSASRKGMASPLIEEQILIGQTKPQVIELLGDDFHHYDENSIMYHLEKYPHLPFKNPEILIIQFWGGKVVNVSQNKLYN